MVAAYPIEIQPDPGLDHAIWRILSCARAAGVDVSDEQLRAALEQRFSPDRLQGIAAARARVLDKLDVDAEPGAPTEPSTSLDEAIDCGLLGISRQEWEQLCASSI